MSYKKFNYDDYLAHAKKSCGEKRRFKEQPPAVNGLFSYLCQFCGNWHRTKTQPIPRTEMWKRSGKSRHPNKEWRINRNLHD